MERCDNVMQNQSPSIHHGGEKVDAESFTPPNNCKRRFKKMFSINRNTLPCKIALLCVSLCQGSVNPFVNAFLRSVGFTASQAGFVSGIRTFAQMISNPIFAAIADKSRKHQLVFILLCCSSIAFVVPEPWYALLLRDSKFVLSSISNSSLPTNSSRVDSKDSFRSLISSPTDSSASNLYFIGMASIICMAGFSDGPLLNFVDSQTVYILSTDPSGPSYGQQRAFGSIGYGLATILGGILTGHALTKGHEISKYTPVFYVYLAGALLLILAGIFLYRKRVYKSDDCSKYKPEDSSKSPKVASLIVQSIKQPDLLFFYCSAMVMGIADCTLVSFFFLLLEDIGAPGSIMGLCIGLQNICELFVLPFASKIIRCMGGVYVAVLMGATSYVVRFLLVSFLDNVWLILATSVLHIFCFAIYWTAALEKVSSLCSKEVCTTILGFHNAIYFGLGSLLGNVIGGHVYHEFGGRWLYRGAAGVCLLWVLVVFPKFVLERRRRVK